MNGGGVAGAESVDSAPAVKLEGITKRYGSVVACDEVDLTLSRGRIHGVLGENGAGKSTLMKIMIGLTIPDAGLITIDGERCQITDPIDAARRGVAMVHQHFSLVEPLTVWENVALGDVGRLDPPAVRRRVGELSEHYGLAIDPDAIVGDLPAGLRQRVEIIKCLRRDPAILIFDEPTSVLTPEESEQLFSSLRDVIAREGRAVALVSHKLDEILQATDDVTIMRQGRVVERMSIADADASSLANAMVGREVALRSERVALGVVDTDLAGTEIADVDVEHAECVLRVDDLTMTSRDGRKLLDGLSLQVRAGEVLGVAGVEGNGQRHLGDVLSSLINPDRGTVQVGDEMVPVGTPGAMARAGIGVIPEDRHDSGVVLGMTVAENMYLVDPSRVSTAGLIRPHEAKKRAEQLIEEFGISCTGPDAPMWSLSGGNQQRVVLARELAQDPKVLVAAQPTHGLDVGAIEYMTDRIRRAAESGLAVLLISSELEEILDLAHRIVVMHEGRIIGEMRRDDVDIERLGRLIGGQQV
jgi:general nucleoside transport system ATP-binding protein